MSAYTVRSSQPNTEDNIHQYKYDVQQQISQLEERQKCQYQQNMAKQNNILNQNLQNSDFDQSCQRQINQSNQFIKELFNDESIFNQKQEQSQSKSQSKINQLMSGLKVNNVPQNSQYVSQINQSKQKVCNQDLQNYELQKLSQQTTPAIQNRKYQTNQVSQHQQQSQSQQNYIQSQQQQKVYQSTNTNKHKLQPPLSPLYLELDTQLDILKSLNISNQEKLALLREIEQIVIEEEQMSQNSYIQDSVQNTKSNLVIQDDYVQSSQPEVNLEKSAQQCKIQKMQENVQYLQDQYEQTHADQAMIEKVEKLERNYQEMYNFLHSKVNQLDQYKQDVSQVVHEAEQLIDTQKQIASQQKSMHQQKAQQNQKEQTQKLHKEANEQEFEKIKQLLLIQKQKPLNSSNLANNELPLVQSCELLSSEVVISSLRQDLEKSAGDEKLLPSTRKRSQRMLEFLDQQEKNQRSALNEIEQQKQLKLNAIQNVYNNKNSQDRVNTQQQIEVIQSTYKKPQQQQQQQQLTETYTQTSPQIDQTKIMTDTQVQTSFKSEEVQQKNVVSTQQQQNSTSDLYSSHKTKNTKSITSSLNSSVQNKQFQNRFPKTQVIRQINDEIKQIKQTENNLIQQKKNQVISQIEQSKINKRDVSEIQQFNKEIEKTPIISQSVQSVQIQQNYNYISHLSQSKIKSLKESVFTRAHQMLSPQKSEIPKQQKKSLKDSLSVKDLNGELNNIFEKTFNDKLQNQIQSKIQQIKRKLVTSNSAGAKKQDATPYQYARWNGTNVTQKINNQVIQRKKRVAVAQPQD